MTDNCNIIRDLMPLVIDEAASEESAQCVHQHVDRCESCRIYYDGMKHMSDSRKAREEEERSFALAAQKMKKKRRARLVRNVLIGMLIGCIMAYGGLRAWSYLTIDYTQLVHYGFYGVTLSELETGEVSVNIDFYGSSLVCGVDFERTVEDGKNILYVYLERPFIKQYMENPHSNYSCTRLPSEQMEELCEIRQGRGDEYQIVWQKGMDIPAASEEMNLYFTLHEEYWGLWNSQDQTSDGKMIIRSQEEYEQINLLRDQMRQITVPEWQ